MSPDHHAHDRAETLERLAAAYRRYGEALAARNLRRLSDHLADDYREIDSDGVVFSRAEVETRLRRWLAESGPIDPARVEIGDLRVDGDAVCATVHQRVTRLVPDWPDGRSVSRSLEEAHLVDRWRDEGGRWLLEERRHRDPGISGTLAPLALPVDSPRLVQLAAEIDGGDPTALERFWAEVDGRAPLVERVEADDRRCWVTFVWRDDAVTRDVAVGGDLPSPDVGKPLRRLGETDVWFHTVRLRRTFRGSYAFTGVTETGAPAGFAYRVELSDPLNPRRSGTMSWLELPDAPPQPHIVRRPEVPRGSLIHATCASRILGEDRPYAVHLPAGFDPEAGAALLVAFDGQVYGSAPDASIPAPVIVDNLVAAGLIPPTAVLLVDNLPGTRDRDLTCHPPFFEFLARELLPEVRSAHGLAADPGRTVATGSSFGGLAAAYCGLRHADTFGNVLSQSGSYWFVPGWREAVAFPHEADPGWMMSAFAASPRLPVRFWMEVGRLDGPKTVLCNRHLRSVLELKGYDVTYSEFEGGHTSVCWRGSLADGLVALLGPADSRPVPS